MQNGYRTVLRGGTGEIEEKKSKFIAVVEHVESEEEAAALLASCRKKYWDASHHCSAYVIGKKQELRHCSDDGEPGGTAGRPMLDVLLGEGLCDVAVVVIRYFGGTLLGTGGLVRAYSGAVKAGLKESVLIEKLLGKRVAILTDYNSVGKLQYLLAQMEIAVLESEYTEAVRTVIVAEPERFQEFQEKITEATAGGARFEELKPCYFAKVGKEIQIFEIY